MTVNGVLPSAAAIYNQFLMAHNTFTSILFPIIIINRKRAMNYRLSCRCDIGLCIRSYCYNTINGMNSHLIVCCWLFDCWISFSYKCAKNRRLNSINSKQNCAQFMCDDYVAKVCSSLLMQKSLVDESLILTGYVSRKWRRHSHARIDTP